MPVVAANYCHLRIMDTPHHSKIERRCSGCQVDHPDSAARCAAQDQPIPGSASCPEPAPIARLGPCHGRSPPHLGGPMPTSFNIGAKLAACRRRDCRAGSGSEATTRPVRRRGRVRLRHGQQRRITPGPGIPACHCRCPVGLPRWARDVRTVIRTARRPTPSGELARVLV